MAGAVSRLGTSESFCLSSTRSTATESWGLQRWVGVAASAAERYSFGACNAIAIARRLLLGQIVTGHLFSVADINFAVDQCEVIPGFSVNGLEVAKNSLGLRRGL